MLCFCLISDGKVLNHNIMLPTDSVPCIKLHSEVVERKTYWHQTFISEICLSQFHKISISVIANFIMCDNFTLNNLHSRFGSSLYVVELFILNHSYMLYYIEPIEKLKVVYFESKLGCRIAIFNMINHHNDIAQSKLYSPRSIIEEDYKYLLNTILFPTPYLKKNAVLFIN